jgi:hypothetical protein
MKIVTTIARYLLGLIFLVFGLNMLFPFIPMGPMPTGLAGQFTVALFAAHYFYVVGTVMVISAVLLLLNRFVGLGLTLLGPVLWLPGSIGECLKGCLRRGSRNEGGRAATRGGRKKRRCPSSGATAAPTRALVPQNLYR